MDRLFTKRPVTIETRAEGQRVLTGYGAVFFRSGDPGTEYDMGFDMLERIRPGAFGGVLQDDVRALYNHDPSSLLGRVSARTMRLTQDEIGLRYEIDLPDTQLGKDIAALVERGDLSGSSFSFTLQGGAYKWDDKTEGKSIRWIESVGELYDVGPVTFPAYEATTTAIRAENVEAAKRELDELRRRRDRDLQADLRVLETLFH